MDVNEKDRRNTSLPPAARREARAKKNVRGVQEGRTSRRTTTPTTPKPPPAESVKKERAAKAAKKTALPKRELKIEPLSANPTKTGLAWGKMILGVPLFILGIGVQLASYDLSPLTLLLGSFAGAVSEKGTAHLGRMKSIGFMHLPLISLVRLMDWMTKDDFSSLGKVAKKVYDVGFNPLTTFEEDETKAKKQTTKILEKGLQEQQTLQTLSKEDLDKVIKDQWFGKASNEEIKQYTDVQRTMAIQLRSKQEASAYLGMDNETAYETKVAEFYNRQQYFKVLKKRLEAEKKRNKVEKQALRVIEALHGFYEKWRPSKDAKVLFDESLTEAQKVLEEWIAEKQSEQASKTTSTTTAPKIPGKRTSRKSKNPKGKEPEVPEGSASRYVPTGARATKLGTQ